MSFPLLTGLIGGDVEPGTQEFFNSGNFEVPFYNEIVVEVWGGGGSGAVASGGGELGGGGDEALDGRDGQQSKFGEDVIAGGGSKGLKGSGSTGGAGGSGGSAVGGDVNTAGQAGSAGTYTEAGGGSPPDGGP